MYISFIVIVSTICGFLYHTNGFLRGFLPYILSGIKIDTGGMCGESSNRPKTKKKVNDKYRKIMFENLDRSEK